ncbi:MAG: hypothetical protein RI957_730 [Verrucomicrobiota bacterium]|jgi:sialate O-acetylesterase
MKFYQSNKSCLMTVMVAMFGLSMPHLYAAPETSAATTSVPAIEMGAPFRDGAVLQREMKVPVWGWSAAGSQVTVEFASQKKSAVAGKDGKWMVELDPLQASFEPADMKISESGGKSHTLKNLLVGEVWFASGQSNMQWLASKCDVGQLQKQIADRVAAGQEKAPVIREAKVADYFATLYPIEHANAPWHDVGKDMSAIAYSFAYHVFREVNVPIGILNGSFSETSIQAWTPREGFRDATDEASKAMAQKLRETDPSTPEHKEAWETYYAQVESDMKAGKEIATKTPGNMNGNRDATWMFNARLNPMIPYAVRGGIWNQGYANINEGLQYYHNLHNLIRGWRMVWGRQDMPVYFNQFYCPQEDPAPSFGGMAEMRMGTWLARDIPQTGMASQIDITGAIHYFNKTLSGQRLALHALKNQYGKAVVADGPMFRSYRVNGKNVIVELDHAEGGLVVAETASNAKTGLGKPTVIPDGAAQLKLFYLAGEDRVWHPAQVRIDGETLIVSSAKVPAPRGVSYGGGGIGGLPNLYSKAMLPLTPFLQFDQKLVTSKTWAADSLKIDGVVVDPNSIGLQNEYRKMPLLSNQFRSNAVLQCDQPLTIWGSALHDWGYEAKGKAEIHFRFAGMEKTIPVTPGMREWQVVVPAMPASAEPKTLTVRFTIDGELAHERVCENIVIGDVWYVAAPGGKWQGGNSSSAANVRMMTRKSKGDRSENVRRFSVSTSNTLDSRFSSFWEDASGLPAALGQRLAGGRQHPVGVIFMQSAGSGEKDLELKHWIPAEFLNKVPTLVSDYRQLASLRPGTEEHAHNIQRYLNEWRKYWGSYIPELRSSRAVPDRVPWGSYPGIKSLVDTDAAQAYNTMVSPFTPAAFKGIIFLSGPAMVVADQGEHFGEQLTALALGWKEKFGCEKARLICTIPAASLAPKIKSPPSIEAKFVEIKDWAVNESLLDAIVAP